MDFRDLMDEITRRDFDHCEAERKRFAAMPLAELIATVEHYFKNSSGPRNHDGTAMLPGSPSYDSALYHLLMPELLRRLKESVTVGFVSDEQMQAVFKRDEIEIEVAVLSVLLDERLGENGRIGFIRRAAYDACLALYRGLEAIAMLLDRVASHRDGALARFNFDGTARVGDEVISREQIVREIVCAVECPVVEAEGIVDWTAFALRRLPKVLNRWNAIDNDTNGVVLQRVPRARSVDELRGRWAASY